MISITKKYMTWQRSIYKSPTSLEKAGGDLSWHSIVFAVDEAIENGRQLVEAGNVRGWVEVAYLETYVESLPFDCVDVSGLQTPSLTDAQQYIVYDGQKIVNACGMISIAWILGLPLVEVFDTWRERNNKHYLAVRNSRFLTSSADLKTILSCFGVVSERLSLSKYQPETLAELMRNQDIILSVRIDKITGRLAPSGILHWVSPVSIWQDRYEYGTIDINNPLPNRIERYSWKEFITAAGAVYGIMKGKV